MSSRVFVCALVALAVAACTPASPGAGRSTTGGDPSTGGNPGGDPVTPGGDPVTPGGDPTPPPTTVPEYSECLSGSTCAAGLSCSAFEGSRRTYCLKGCLDDSTCAAGERCLLGTCRRLVPPYGVVGAFDDCGPTAMAYATVPVAPLRCVPICDVGDLVGYQAVAVCPPLPTGIVGGEPVCTRGVVPTTTASFCTAEVREGEVCDQASLRCNVAGTRPDTDAAQGATGAGGNDPGALGCLPHQGESRCQRVCAVGTGAQSPCGCAGDPLCSEPADPGVAWSCVSWNEVAGPTTRLYGCIAVEPCAADAVCADDTIAGTTRCATSPYTPYAGSMASVCLKP